MPVRYLAGDGCSDTGREGEERGFSNQTAAGRVFGRRITVLKERERTPGVTPAPILALARQPASRTMASDCAPQRLCVGCSAAAI